VGRCVGCGVVGAAVGIAVVGAADGFSVGCEMVGDIVGSAHSKMFGLTVIPSMRM